MTISYALLLSVLSAPSPAPRPYDVQNYSLNFKLLDEGAFQTKVTITLKPTKATSEIELDSYGLNIESALVNSEAADLKLKPNPATEKGTLTLKVKKPLTPNKDVTVEIKFNGKAGKNHAGFFTSTDSDVKDALPGYYTHLEPFYAQRFFPCNDNPADKATTEVEAIVDARYTVISNGRKEKDEKYSEEGKNLRRVHFKQEVPHSTYLVALAIAQLEEVVVSEEVPSSLWVPIGTKDRAFQTQDMLKGLYNFQAGFLGTKYPFSKLDVVAVPKFFWGGMENTSVIFQRSSLVVVDNKNDLTTRSRITQLLSHEMAHQYFGDFVTCATFDEVWLNEGFATYLGQATADDAFESDEIEVARAAYLHDTHFTAEDGIRSHPLLSKPDNVEDSFDSISYGKGAAVLRMLEHWVGKPEMKKVLKAYLEKFGGKAATSQDFFKVVFDTTKKEKELKAFKESWLTKKGYPIIFPESNFSNGKLTITIRQQPNQAGEKGPFVFKLPIVIHRLNEPAYTKEEVILVDKPEVKVEIDVPGVPEWINWNKNMTALVKVNSATVSEPAFIDAARSDDDSVWRLIAAHNLLGNLTARKIDKDPAMPSDSAMGAIADVLTKDTSAYVRENILQKLSDTRLKKLPAQLAPILLQLAKKPDGLSEDAAGYIRVRRAAMEALGRVDSPLGHAYLMEELGKRDIDINYLTGFAKGCARIGTPASISVLRAALVTQKSRGFGYYRRVVTAIPLVSSTDAVSIIREVLAVNKGNNEIGRAIVDDVPRNREIIESNDWARLVGELVLDEAGFAEELQADALLTLDSVKSDAAKTALTSVFEKSKSERLKQLAKKSLDATFPSAAPVAPAAPGKKGKKP
jgi:aminopeptidase N